MLFFVIFYSPKNQYNVPIYSMCMYINGTTGLKAQLKKKMCYSLHLKYIIVEKIYTLYWTLMEQQILCKNKSFKLFILFKIV